jgi:hypothetical protein
MVGTASLSRQAGQGGQGVQQGQGNKGAQGVQGGQGGQATKDRNEGVGEGQGVQERQSSTSSFVEGTSTGRASSLLVVCIVVVAWCWGLASWGAAAGVLLHPHHRHVKDHN